MIRTNSIQHSYSGIQRFIFPDIKCNHSETLLILGESGVGKTTLLHILAGILKPDSGEVWIQDESLYEMNVAKRDKFRGKHIGLVFQRPHFVNSVTARENIALANQMAGLATNKEKINEVLKRLKLDARADANVTEMSEGELQRLSIARAMINKPALILADEPTSSLDDTNCEEVVQLLDHHAKDVGASLIIVTHDYRLKSIFPHFIELN